MTKIHSSLRLSKLGGGIKENSGGGECKYDVFDTL
jgi:hypothetical protein